MRDKFYTLRIHLKRNYELGEKNLVFDGYFPWWSDDKVNKVSYNDDQQAYWNDLEGYDDLNYAEDYSGDFPGILNELIKTFNKYGYNLINSLRMPVNDNEDDLYLTFQLNKNSLEKHDNTYEYSLEENSNIDAIVKKLEKQIFKTILETSTTFSSFDINSGRFLHNQALINVLKKVNTPVSHIEDKDLRDKYLQFVDTFAPKILEICDIFYNCDH